MPPVDIVRDLELLVRSRYALIVLDTIEDDRAESVMQYLAAGLGLPLFHWNASQGLCRAGTEAAAYDTGTPAKALAFIAASPIAALYHLEGFGDFLSDAAIVAKLKAAAMHFGRNAGALIISGGGITIPDSVSSISTRVALPALELDDYRKLLGQVVRETGARMTVEVDLTDDQTNQLLGNLRGVTLMEAERILTRAIVEDGKLDASDIERVVASKRERIAKDGVLQYVPADTGMNDVIGLAGLKTWLAKRRLILTDTTRASQFGLSFPKGLLLLGVPGCGKSLCAKAVAKEWALPLLKLDAGSLYDKFIGETEKNFRKAMDTAERVAPDVLWIDEIEKAFAAGGGGMPMVASPPASSAASSPGSRTGTAMCSSSRPRTTSSGSRPSCCARGASTRSSSWTSPRRTRVPGSSRRTFANGTSRWSASTSPRSAPRPTDSAARRSNKSWSRHSTVRSPTTTTSPPPCC